MFYIRKAFQALSLIVFFTLIYYTTYPLSPGGVVTIFPQASPFLFLAGVFLVPAIILIGLTLIFGRVFCGWICPLGCLLEYIHMLFPKRIPGVRRGMKYYLLVGLGVCLPLLWHIEPLCLLQRVGCFILSPYSYTPYFILTLLIFVIVLFFRRRWCQSLCPLGGLLSLLSRYKRIKRTISPACNQCGRCQKACWMEIGKGDERRKANNPSSLQSKACSLQPNSDCLLCFRCQQACPRKAVSFCFGRHAPEKIDVTRRGMIFALGAGIVSAFTIRAFPEATDKHLIRPPGALPEKRFMSVCLRCGACTRVCVSHGLVPDFMGSGLIGLGSPRLVPRIGACEDFCNLCGQVCPSGAIQGLTEDEKRRKKIGTAVIDTKRCLAYKTTPAPSGKGLLSRENNTPPTPSQEGNRRLCLVCDEQCLYNAISMDERKRPVVDREKCMGCGVCENRCPVQGEAAIRVVGI